MLFVTSKTRKTNKLENMILVDRPTPYLEQYKSELLNRKIIEFDESNWWKWGRGHYVSDKERIYVNCKNYDGAVLAIFPYSDKMDCNLAVKKFNEVDWNELGFMCGNRYIFSQRSLENINLPDEQFKEIYEELCI